MLRNCLAKMGPNSLQLHGTYLQYFCWIYSEIKHRSIEVNSFCASWIVPLNSKIFSMNQYFDFIVPSCPTYCFKENQTNKAQYYSYLKYFEDFLTEHHCIQHSYLHSPLMPTHTSGSGHKATNLLALCHMLLNVQSHHLYFKNAFF